MPFITTVQDPEDLKMLLNIGGLKAIKVGSDDFDHPINLKIYAKIGLPLIISKGMTTLGEVDEVINDLAKHTSQLAVLHCVSLYPTNPEQLNIKQVSTLKELYPDVVWGFSDHSQGVLASTVAASIGANIIEKHFTLDHNLPGPDHWFSMDLIEMKELVDNIRFAEKALGDGNVSPSKEEMKSKSIMRRRIVAKEDIEPGTTLNDKNITFKRSDNGCFISHWNFIRGSQIKVFKKLDQGINLSDITFK
jgi:N-acetylneuraminate synthase/N,N'-diacetyllegionaminate synthase